MIGRGLLFVGLAVAVASSSQAQDVGTCEHGTAIRYVVNDQIQASLFNTGSLFFGGSTTSGDGYLIPRDTHNSPMLAAGFWLGGLVDADLRVAAARYGGWDYWPGPLDAAANPPQDCSEHDRIYVVSRSDISHYYATGELTEDLRDWPHQLGAPVIDGDGDPTNYDLEAGDQPDLIGNVAAWWVMNDAGNEHNPGAPLGVEVRVQAFLYGSRRETASPVLLQTTFVRYEIINRGRQTIEPMYATMWSDVDLGDAGDDYIGSDSLRNMVFVYNDSNDDSAYGSPPPALGIQILQGPIGLANGRDDDFDGSVDEPGESLGSTASGSYIGGGPDGTQDPGRPVEYYNYMRGLWGDGSPRYEYGTGFQQAGSGIRTTRFHFAGDPVTRAYYSEVNTDGNGTVSPQGDRVMMVSTGPFRIAPDESTTLLFAFPFGQGTDNLQSVAVMRGYATALQALAADGFFTSSPVEISRPELPVELGLSHARPNPSRQPEVRVTLPEDAYVRATVYDALGRQLEVLVDAEMPRGENELAISVGLAPGTYLLRVEVAPGAVETLTFTVAR
ncbi:MAG: T9SS type A sorting domain-containing protein [Bacteroidota bacterium]